MPLTSAIGRRLTAERRDQAALRPAVLVGLLDDVNGIRIVRALSASARATVRRIHQMA